MPRPAPGTRNDYAWFTRMDLRFNDNDIYGHLNNAVHYQLFDTAVAEWQAGAGFATGPGTPWLDLVVESGCRYIGEAAYPDTVHAGLRLGRIGKSSWAYEVGLFRNDDESAFAEGFFAMVLADFDSHAPTPIPDDIRAILEGLTPSNT